MSTVEGLPASPGMFEGCLGSPEWLARVEASISVDNGSESDRFFWGPFKLLVIEDAAFCAAENIEEKKPFCWLEVLLGDFDNSSTGPRDEIEDDNLLGP